MTGEDREIDQDTRDVLDNPEWTAEDVRAGRSLADFAPELAVNMRRDLRTPPRAAPRGGARPAPRKSLR